MSAAMHRTDAENNQFYVIHFFAGTAPFSNIIGHIICGHTIASNYATKSGLRA
jgi:hypothetical protein